MGRRTKTLLPTTQQLLIPKQIKPQAVKRKIQDQKVGDKIRTQKKTHWEPAIVTGVSMKPRSYIITTPQGNVFRRNSYLHRNSMRDWRCHCHPSQKLMTRSSVEKIYMILPGTNPSKPKSENIANQTNENDVSLEKHGEHNTGCQSSEGGQQSLRRSTRVKRRPDYYLESHSEPSTNIRKGGM